MKRLVIGILAHVDSGKTTLSEAMLFNTGAIRRIGRVDHGDAFLDNDKIERERGITIFSKQARLTIGETEFVLLDTPGHVDFAAETERTLAVLDYAILVVSGSEGVQSHTITLWHLLEKYNIPTFVFVNKCDISAYTRPNLISMLRAQLKGLFVDFSNDSTKAFPSGEGVSEADGRGTASSMDEVSIPSNEFYEEVSMANETLMEDFLNNGELSIDQISSAIWQRQIFPCFFGSALKQDGVNEFLDGLSKFTINLTYPTEFGARVYKIGDDRTGKRMTYLKVTGGKLTVRDEVLPNDIKVSELRTYSGEKFTPSKEVFAGDVCAMLGPASTYVGQGLGFEKESTALTIDPLFSYKVALVGGDDPHTALTQLKKLEQEETQLHIAWNEQTSEITIQLMGGVQLEVLKELIKDRFGMDVEFRQGNILYKETIATTVEGVGHYEPLRHYAEVHLLMEPAERGSGLTFDADCSLEVLGKNWQNLVLTHLHERVFKGVLTNSPITDMKITLVSGRAHIKHTEGGDFRQATYRAVRQGLMMARSVLLEPWYDFELTLPNGNVGRAMTDIGAMGGKISTPTLLDDGTALLTGSGPVSQLNGYQAEVTSYTHGTGKIVCRFGGYDECQNPDEVIAKIGYDAEADTFNSADSVFCSHGSGVYVKWNQVYNNMHIPLLNGMGGASSGHSLENMNASSQYNSAATEFAFANSKRYFVDCSSFPKRGAFREPYKTSIATDEELMAIFERTYGKIKSRVPRHSTTQPLQSLQSQTQDAAPLTATLSQNAGRFGSPVGLKSRKKTGQILLVDGYNVIFAWDELKKIADDGDLATARKTLCDRLCGYQMMKQIETIVVFDAYKVKDNPGSTEKYHNITVVYTKEAQTADSYIERATHELGRHHNVRVATSDNLEQVIILGNGALRISANEFHSEVTQTEQEMRSFIEKMRH